VTFIQRRTVGVLDFFEFALHVEMPVLVLEHLYSDGFEQCILKKIQQMKPFQTKPLWEQTISVLNEFLNGMQSG
jgi:hypothetical protein